LTLLTQEAPESSEELLARQRDAICDILSGAFALEEHAQVIQGAPLLRQLKLDRYLCGAVLVLDPVRWMASRDGGCLSKGALGIKGESYLDPHEKRFYHRARKERPA
jgi:hypothetical protein